MLPKKNRIKKKSFPRSGKTLTGEFFTLKISKSPEERFRGAVVVSKKISAKATSRNKLRRQVYEILRKESRAFVLNADIVVIARRGAENATKKKIHDDVNSLLRASGILVK